MLAVYTACDPKRIFLAAADREHEADLVANRHAGLNFPLVPEPRQPPDRLRHIRFRPAIAEPHRVMTARRVEIDP